MTAKRPPKKQPKRDRLLANTLLTKPTDKCTLEECLRLRAFYNAALKYLGANPAATVTKLSVRKQPSTRGTAGAVSRAA
jgi:hypothetical protein